MLEQYAPILTNLVESLRRETKRPTLPFVMVETFNGDINKQMQKVADKLDGVVLLQNPQRVKLQLHQNPALSMGEHQQDQLRCIFSTYYQHHTSERPLAKKCFWAPSLPPLDTEFILFVY